MAPDEEQHEQVTEEHVEATEERDELIIGALAAAGQQINELAGEARELKEAASNRRKDDRRRDIMLALLCVLLVLGLLGQVQAYGQRQDISHEQQAGNERGNDIKELLTTVKRCIAPAEGEAPDCGQQAGGGSNSAAQAVVAINNFQLDVAACQASVAASEYDACVQQRQAERQGEDGG